MKKLFLLSITTLSVFALSACSKNSAKEPVVMEMKQEVSKAPTINSLISTDEAVSTTIKLRKSSLLDRAFFYGSSLQFSSIVDDGLATAMMGLSLGQVPAEFKIFGDKLRLVTDGRISFESDVNHPSRLIHEFQIVTQDKESISIVMTKASPVLAAALFDVAKSPTINTWIRSLEFVQADELFLIESSVEQSDGSLAEVMETIRPRDKVIPADFKAISADTDLNDDATRYRFLDAGEVYLDIPEKGRIKTSVAQRFHAPEGKPIKWYVTKNIPDEFLRDVKNGVEGWNRYSQAMWNRDIVKFEGRLPDGIKVGDPRFNLIIWDSVKDAGAAYESQNSDPVTGFQMHSMIYLPKAWVNIAKEYWTNAQYSEDEQEAKVKKASDFLKKRSFLGRRLPVNCIDGAHMHVSLLARENLDQFSHSLLKGVLFHEMGHALGFAHNFKGSLSFDQDQNEKDKFTTSVMDYNNYNVEAGAFSSVESADGPIFEYDRQLLSVLYNGGEDVLDTDPELPACADEESDSLEDGIDPLCIRYDIGKDPTIVAQRSLELLSDPAKRSGRMSSLPLALPRTLKDLPDASKAETLKQAVAGVAKALLTTKGITAFYVSDFYRSVINSLRTLHVFQEDVLPEEYNETEMRERTLVTLDQLMSLNSYPMATKQALNEVRAGIQNWILSTPAFSKLNETDRSAALNALMTKVDANLKAMELAQMSRMRARVAAELTYEPTAPFSFHKREDQIVDIESQVVGYLQKLGIEQARPLTERAAGISALVTFKNETGNKATSELKASLVQEIQTSQDAVKREVLRKFLAALK